MARQFWPTIVHRFAWMSGISLCLALIASPMGLRAEPIDGSAEISIREWNVPFGGRPRDPFAVDKKSIWFVGQKKHYLAKLNPGSGKIEQYPLPSDSGPHNLIVGRNGIVWYAGNLQGFIGRYDPDSEKFDKIDMPDPAARDPHTLVFDKDEKHIWFTVQHGNFIGRLTLASKKVDLIAVPTRGARPYGIVVAPSGKVWAVLFATNKLAAVDPKTLKLTEYEIPDEFARPRRLAVTPDGTVWWADYTRGVIGAYDPKTKTFKDWPLPSKDKALPYGMALDDKGRLWVVETGVSPNQFVGFDTKTKTVIANMPIPSGAGAVRHMHYHQPTQTVWFGTDNSTVGRALLEPEPETEEKADHDDDDADSGIDFDE